MAVENTRIASVVAIHSNPGPISNHPPRAATLTTSSGTNTRNPAAAARARPAAMPSSDSSVSGSNHPIMTVTRGKTRYEGGDE